MALLKPRLLVLTSMVLAAVASRLIPHPPNITAIASVALFGGACFADKRLAFLVPLTALLLSDLVLGFYRHMEGVYLSFALIVGIGLLLQRHRTVLTTAGAVLASSILFFGITNFYVWAFGTMYPHTASGLAACYTAAIPFFRNEMLGDFLYSALLFGGFALLEKTLPMLRRPGLNQAALPG
jgi:hypothetical protein